MNSDCGFHLGNGFVSQALPLSQNYFVYSLRTIFVRIWFFFCYSLSVMVLCSSCRDLTTPQPGLFMDSIPEAVAFAAAMVVM